MTRSPRRRRVSNSLDLLEYSAVSVANFVANVTALEVTSAARRRMVRVRTPGAKGGSLRGRTFQQRSRRSVHDIYKELGEGYFRRAYQMKYSTFKRLANELCLYIKDASGQRGTARRHTPNGPISQDVRLACAL
jgi:hypothetical protein